MQSNDAWVPRFLVIDDEPSSSTSCDWGEIFWKPPKHKVFLFLAWKDGSCWDKLSYTSAFWDWMFDDSFFALERYVDADMFPSWNIVNLHRWKWPTWFRMLASLTDHDALIILSDFGSSPTNYGFEIWSDGLYPFDRKYRWIAAAVVHKGQWHGMTNELTAGVDQYTYSALAKPHDLNLILESTNTSAIRKRAVKQTSRGDILSFIDASYTRACGHDVLRFLLDVVQRLRRVDPNQPTTEINVMAT